MDYNPVSWVSRLRGDPSEVDQIAAEWADLRQASSARIDRMETYRAENSRTRDTQVDINVADMTDYGRGGGKQANPQRHDIPIPLGMASSIKHAYRISGRLPDVVVDRRDETPAERYRSDTMEKVIWAILRESGGETQFADGAWDSSQIGSACFDLYFDVKKQMPMLRAVDPVGIVEVQGLDDPHDFQRVYRAWTVPTHVLRAQYRGMAFRDGTVDVERITGDFKTGTTEMSTIVQMCDKERLLRFLPSCNVALYEYVHNYGFTPYVVIPNLGPYRDVWGWADYELIRPLLAYMGANLSREADILRAVANGVYIEKGTGQNTEGIKRTLATGGVVPSKRDGELEPVATPDIPNFAMEHSNKVMELFKMLGFTPDAAWGNGGSGSGADRGLQLQPLMELTAMKQQNWMRGLSRLGGYAFQMIEQKMATGAKYRGAKQGVGARRMPFVVGLDPNAGPEQRPNPSYDPETVEGIAADEFIELPRSPKELFDGDYAVRFVWQNRIDPDDPSFILSEINKFQSGAQSLRTTLERLGCQAPEDEMRQIEQEAERFPWINQGMVSLVMAQLRGNAQGTGGGAPEDTQGALGGALETMMGGGGGASGALDADAGAQAAGATGQMYGGA